MTAPREPCSPGGPGRAGAALGAIEWGAPAPYRVAFSTRAGGVSEGPYRSLNLGVRTGDDPGRVLENRRRLLAAVGANPRRAAMAWQQHGARVVEASPTGILRLDAARERCDGLWSRRRGVGLVLVTADCLPVALWRKTGEPALAVLHVGWRGLLAGILAEGVRALGDGPVAAVIGPGIGRCCYEVGEDVAAPFRQRFGRAVATGGRLDLAAAAARALAEAGCARVEHVDLCTACDPGRFFSHRRDGGVTGRQGVVAYVE